MFLKIFENYDLKVLNLVLYHLKLLMSFACHSHAICMSLGCTRMSFVCHSYVLLCHPYLTRLYSYVIRM